MGSVASVFTYDPNQAATIASQGQPAWTGTTFPTSTQATPIPILYGSRRLSPNILWQSRQVRALATSGLIINQPITATPAGQVWATKATIPYATPPFNGFETPAFNVAGLPTNTAIFGRVFGQLLAEV